MTALRIVLDSNVIISAFLFGGQPARIVGYVLDGSLQCFVSMAIFDEIQDVLQRPKFGLSAEQALAFIEELHNLCWLVTPTTRVRAIRTDPDDNRVLECALAADADMIISGDSHLLNLGQWQDIRILSPAEFIREFEGQ